MEVLQASEEGPHVTIILAIYTGVSLIAIMSLLHKIVSNTWFLGVCS